MAQRNDNQCCDRRAGLTPAGVLHSWLLGTAIYSAFGPGGYTIVCLYFLLGSAVCASSRVTTPLLIASAG